MLYKLSITFLHQNKIILNLVLILHIKVVQLTKQICKKTKKKQIIKIALLFIQHKIY